VLAGCGKSEPTKSEPAATPIASAPAQKPAEPPPAPAASSSPAAAAAEPTPAEPAPAAGSAGSNAPKDTVIHVSTADEFARIEKLIAPYSEKARKTYPEAKRRYLAGLPKGDIFSVTTKLRNHTGQEVAFIAVDSIKGDQITGHIASELAMPDYKKGDRYTMAERDIVDWVILHPDGVEEGNVVGKFLEDWGAKQQKGG
jgi:hypothetical protein